MEITKHAHQVKLQLTQEQCWALIVAIESWEETTAAQIPGDVAQPGSPIAEARRIKATLRDLMHGRPITGVPGELIYRPTQVNRAA